MLIIGLIDLLIAVLFLDTRILIFGFTLGTLVLIYLGFIMFKSKLIFIPKEILIALIYAVGVWSGPFLINKKMINVENTTLFVIFLLLAFTNTLILALFEVEDDIKAGMTSLATTTGKTKSKKLILIITSFNFLIIFIFAFLMYDIKIALYSLVIFLLMNMILTGVLIYNKFLNKNKLYKAITEFTFLLPLLSLTVH